MLLFDVDGDPALFARLERCFLVFQRMTQYVQDASRWQPKINDALRYFEAWKRHRTRRYWKQVYDLFEEMTGVSEHDVRNLEPGVPGSSITRQRSVDNSMLTVFLLLHQLDALKNARIVQQQTLQASIRYLHNFRKVCDDLVELNRKHVVYERIFVEVQHVQNVVRDLPTPRDDAALLATIEMATLESSYGFKSNEYLTSIMKEHSVDLLGALQMVTAGLEQRMHELDAQWISIIPEYLRLENEWPVTVGLDFHPDVAGQLSDDDWAAAGWFHGSIWSVL